MQQGACHACGAVIEQEEKVGRQQTCLECNAYLHCCKNCRFFDETAYNECREPQAERVVDKEQANFCDYFELGAGDSLSGSSKQAESKQALEDLFKK